MTTCDQLLEQVRTRMFRRHRETEILLAGST